MEGMLITIQKALHLLVTGDPELWSIVMLSFSVSLKAIILTTPPAMLVAYSLVNGNFPGIRIILTVFNSLLSVPTVVILSLIHI